MDIVLSQHKVKEPQQSDEKYLGCIPKSAKWLRAEVEAIIGIEGVPSVEAFVLDALAYRMLYYKSDEYASWLTRHKEYGQAEEGNRSHSPVHRSNDAESVAVRIAKQGLRVGANRILRLVCLTDSTPT